MIARIIESKIKLENKSAYLNIIEQEILPLLRQQIGFVEILSFFPEAGRDEKVFTISIWTMKADADLWEREFHETFSEKLKPYLTGQMTMKPYTLETPLFEQFADALSA